MSVWSESNLRFKSERIAAKSKGCCWYCGKGLTKGTATYDHVVPRSLGGLTTVENLVLACSPCNQAKAALTLEEYRSKVGARRFYGEGERGALSVPEVLPR